MEPSCVWISCHSCNFWGICDNSFVNIEFILKNFGKNQEIATKNATDATKIVGLSSNSHPIRFDILTFTDKNFIQFSSFL